MKTHTQASLNQQPIKLNQIHLRLDLYTPGRGIFEIQSPIPPKAGDGFQFSAQLPSQPMRSILIGYVESVLFRDQLAPDLKRYSILVRELSASLNRTLPLNERHALPENILTALSQQTGLQFILPASHWTQIQIPRFQSIGTGYHALDGLLKAFEVEQGVWFQQNDGQIYVGELEKSLPGQRQVELPANLFQALNLKGGTLPLIPRLRPGVRVKIGEHLHWVTGMDIQNETMRLNWQANLFSDFRRHSVPLVQQ